MLIAIPRVPPAAALVWIVVFATCVGSAALAAKPRDFGTPSAGNPSAGISSTGFATPAAVQTTIGNAPVCTAPYDQQAASMESDAGGNSVVAWSDHRNGNLDIFVQKLSPAGAPLWIINGLPACKFAGSQVAPKVVPDGLGGVIVVWQDSRSLTSSDIYAQRLNASGVPLWTTNGIVVCDATGDQTNPVAVGDNAGGLVIAWIDDRVSGSDVYVQRLNPSGVPQWTANGVALCTAPGVQQDLAIVSDGFHGAYAAWQDQRASVAGDIYARLVTGAGAPQGTVDGTVVCTAAGAQEKPVATTDEAGGVVVSWADRRGASYDIYAQRLGGTGALWTADGVAICAAAGDQRAPQVCPDGPGGAFVTWQDNRGGATADIYAQRVDGFGVGQWLADGLPVCVAVADQITPGIHRDPVGGAVISWADARTVASGFDIYAQRVSEAGAMLWTADGVQLCNVSGNQDMPVEVTDGVGGALVVWRDYRTPYADLYAQQVDATGQIASQCVPPDTLGESVLQVLTGGQNYKYFYDSVNAFPIYYWAGVGVRGDPGSDWDIEAYDQDSYNLTPYPSCFGNSLAGSYGASDVDFVMFNLNELHTPPGTYGIRASRYSGAGSSTVEFDGGPNLIPLASNATPGNSVSGIGWTGVLNVFDVSLTAGVTYTIDLQVETGGSAKALLFSSFGAPGYYYVVPRSARVLETSGRYMSYVAPSTEYYGIALVNETGVPTTYTLKVWSDTPTVGVGDVPGMGTGIQGVSPNPAQGHAQISFSLREGADVSFDMLDMAGRVVSRIPSRRWEAGAWNVTWDGRSTGGAPLSPGIYFVQMLAGDRRVGLGRVALVR